MHLININNSFLTSNDRFAMFSFHKNINTLVNLSEKNPQSNEFIKICIENMILTTKNDLMEESSMLFKCIVKTYNYLVKKSNHIFNKLIRL